MARRLAAVIACVFCLAAPAAADEVLLANGDRLTGRVVSMALGRLIFDTGNGTLDIPWNTVWRLTVDEPIIVTLDGLPPTQARIIVGDAFGRAVLLPGGPVNLNQIVRLAHDERDLVIDGGAAAGFVATTGNTDVNSLRLDGDVSVREEENRYSASAAVNRAEDRGFETARNWNAAFNYDRFFSERLFGNANLILTNDTFRDLDLRTAFGVGVGYDVFESALAKLTASAGVGYVKEDFESFADDNYAAFREGIVFNLFLVPERFELFHQHDGYFGADDNRFIRMRNGARLGLFAGFITTAQHDFDYDSSPPPGRFNVDQTFSVTFGYRF